MNSFTLPPYSLSCMKLFTSFTNKHLLLFLCLLMFPASVARAQGTQTPGTAETRAAASGGGVITGRITGEDGQPLAYATVNIYRAFASGPGQQPQAISTDEEGKFLTTNLAQGLYLVNAYAPGLVTAPDATPESGEPRYYRAGDSVNLTLVKGGVITGTVRDASGEPVVAVPVRAIRVRDANGRALPYNFGYVQARMTDDRGIYRLYGLSAGIYLVSAGGSLGFSTGVGVNAYDGDVPTYYPSSTRDTAADVSVRSGDEAASIDIRYRGDHGHTISGTISGPPSEQGLSYGISIMLRQAASGGYVSTGFVAPTAKPVFSIQGVGDGVYDLIAQQGSSAGNTVASTPRRITVKGADVTGLELTLVPLGSIAGRAALEPMQKKEGCGGANERPATLIETVVNARRAEKNPEESPLLPLFFSGSANTPNDQGDFTIRNLGTGSYRLMARLPTDTWYIRSVILPNATARASTPATKAAATKITSSPSLITLKAGENIAGVTVNIAQDGAIVSGRITGAKEGDENVSVPANLKVYLVPAEHERAEDVLRYSEVKPGDGGTFSFRNLAPGRYWIIARPFIEDESPDRLPRPLAWDADARAKLRREAEAQSTTVELLPCKRVIDQVLRYAAAK